MRLWGALLLSLGGFLWGLGAAGRLKRQARELGELEKTMELAAYAIGRFSRPTPALAQELARTAPGAGGALFGRLAELLRRPGERGIDALWDEALEEVDAAARRPLLAFGRVLGRYGAQEQAQAAERCRGELGALAAQAAERAARGGRVYIALGTAAGAVLAIVML